MSRKQTQFVVLPNEVIYCIFDFLTPVDIFRTFTQINHRYDDLVRFYVKRLDLTNGWQGDRQVLQWIYGIIQILKIDRIRIHLLDDYRFSQLDSLNLINVCDWHKVISKMNLKSLTLWFENDYCYYPKEGLIPQTVTRFSSNTVLDVNAFHMNLIDLNVCVYSMVNLIEIIEKACNVQQLSVTFADNFHNYFCVENYQSDRFETMTTNFHCLNNLTRLSFSTKPSDGTESNEHLPFDQIQCFIDRCFPNNTTLKKVSLKFELIKFYQDMWSTIVRYKNTFDRFDFYASFMVEKKVSKNIEIASTTDHFDFHFEGSDVTHPQGRFMHIYSLPFAFDKLHGFTSCSDLSSRCSFSTVRHLYFTAFHLNRLISFKSLTKCMPRLVSIDCDSLFSHDYLITVPEVIVDRDMFNHVRSLRFILLCWHETCDCRNLLPRLISRMPHLRCLTTSTNTLSPKERQRLHNKWIDVQQYNVESFDISPQCIPHLSTLFLDGMMSYTEELSRFVGSLFIGFPSLSLISFKIVRSCGRDQTPYDKIGQEALVIVQNMDSRLRYLKLNYGDGMAIFYLLNS